MREVEGLAARFSASIVLTLERRPRQTLLQKAAGRIRNPYNTHTRDLLPLPKVAVGFVQMVDCHRSTGGVDGAIRGASSFPMERRASTLGSPSTVLRACDLNEFSSQKSKNSIWYVPKLFQEPSGAGGSILDAVCVCAPLRGASKPTRCSMPRRNHRRRFTPALPPLGLLFPGRLWFAGTVAPVRGK